MMALGEHILTVKNSILIMVIVKVEQMVEQMVAQMVAQMVVAIMPVMMLLFQIGLLMVGVTLIIIMQIAMMVEIAVKKHV